MAKSLENYELMYIIDPDKNEEETAALVARFNEMIGANGTVKEVEEWGKRKLAYPINDKPEGYYVLVKFEADAAFPAELDRVLHITEGIVRSLITLSAE